MAACFVFPANIFKQSILDDIIDITWHQMTTWMNSPELDLENLEESNNKDKLKSKMERFEIVLNKLFFHTHLCYAPMKNDFWITIVDR